MTMIVGHGSGYMTNKRATSREVTECLNEMPKGGLHIADFNFLLRMDDLTEGFNGYFILWRRRLWPYHRNTMHRTCCLTNSYSRVISIYRTPLSHLLSLPTDRGIRWILPMGINYNPDILPPDFPKIILQA